MLIEPEGVGRGQIEGAEGNLPEDKHRAMRAYHTAAAKTGNTSTQSAWFVGAFIDSIEEELRGRGEVSVTAFGKFAISETAKRARVNPRTGQKVEISASRTPTSSAGRSLGDSVKAAS